MKSDILITDRDVLEKNIMNAGFEKYRIVQVLDGIYSGAKSFYEISNIPKNLQNYLDQNFFITKLSIYKKYASKIDATKKYLLRLYDDNIIEAVLMKYDYGYTLCISSQVGCLMGCSFCASTVNSKVRNLSSSELYKQIEIINEEENIRISNIVVMGIGEPFDNYDNVVRFLYLLMDEKGLNIGQRHITISTCGIVPRIYDFANLGLQTNLAISLHSAIDKKRENIMPISKKYSLEELKKSVEYYVRKTGRKISYEYALIDGVNNTDEDVIEIAKFMKGQLAYLNIIPVNPIDEVEFQKPAKKKIIEFKNNLEKKGIKVTIRKEMGIDINGACGQLRNIELT